MLRTLVVFEKHLATINNVMYVLARQALRLVECEVSQQLTANDNAIT